MLSLAPAAAAGDAAPARLPPAVHWQRWRRGGVALSAVLHSAALLAVTVALPARGGQQVEKEPLPVEIVPSPAPAKPLPKPQVEEKKPAEPETKAEKPREKPLPLPPEVLAKPKPPVPPAGEKTP
ncbi:MAG: hypothetical protein KIT16_21315, partial [Rhodospirillaceae bacterium]|nr:hypothetical protein [Rhodospirillaceae bacterium]